MLYSVNKTLKEIPEQNFQVRTLLSSPLTQDLTSCFPFWPSTPLPAPPHPQILLMLSRALDIIMVFF